MNYIRSLARIALSLLIAIAFVLTTSPVTVFSSTSENISDVKNVSLDFKSLYYSKEFYTDYIDALEKLKNKYKDLSDIFQIKDIGVSVQGRDLKEVILGNPQSETKIEINATHHQKEYINTILTLNQIDRILEMLSNDERYNGKKVIDILSDAQIYFIPLVNPDGVELFNNYRYNRILPKGFTTQDITRGNANKINLNRNYPAGFVKGVECGEYPFSEPETKALKDLHETIKFDYSIAYHSEGNKILWFYNQKGNFYNETLNIANLIKGITGYPLRTDEKDMNAYGAGFKDWLLADSIAACTIENGIGSLGDDNINTVEWNKYTAIWDAQKDVPLALVNYLYDKKNVTSTNITSKLMPVNIKINGALYNRDTYSFNGKIFVNQQDFNDFVNNKNTEKRDLNSNIDKNIDISQLESGLLFIDNEEFTLLNTLADSTGYHVYWDETNKEINAGNKDYLLSFINPIWVEATMTGNAKIYKDEDLKKEIAVFQKDSKVILLQDRSEKKANVKQGNISGWTDYKNILPSTKSYLKNVKLPSYIKEYFVNTIDYKSDTNILIWVNLENTTVNIFEKSKNGWKIQKDFPCSIGKNSTPTINGVFKYYKYIKSMQYFNNHLIHKMNFYKEYALHSVLLNPDGSFDNGQIHTAVSHGCIRMLPNDIKWIYENCKLGTTIVTW
jgi:g-D-glutamyl-meso-diaminopimelate peptidase